MASAINAETQARAAFEKAAAEEAAFITERDTLAAKLAERAAYLIEQRTKNASAKQLRGTAAATSFAKNMRAPVLKPIRVRGSELKNDEMIARAQRQITSNIGAVVARKQLAQKALQRATQAANAERVATAAAARAQANAAAAARAQANAAARAQANAAAARAQANAAAARAQADAATRAQANAQRAEANAQRAALAATAAAAGNPANAPFSSAVIGQTTEAAHQTAEEARRVKAKVNEDLAKHKAAVETIKAQGNAFFQLAETSRAHTVPNNNADAGASAGSTRKRLVPGTQSNPSARINVGAARQLYRQGKQPGAPSGPITTPLEAEELDFPDADATTPLGTPSQEPSFFIENANNNGRPISTSTSGPSGPRLNSPTAHIDGTGTGNVRNTPVYKTGSPEVKGQLNAIAAGLPPQPQGPPPQLPPPLPPDPEAERVLSEASRRARAAAAAAVKAEDDAIAAAAVVRSLRERPLNTTALGDLNAVRGRLATDKAVLKGVRDKVDPLERTIASKQSRLAEVEAEFAALVTKRQGLVIPNSMPFAKQRVIQQEQVDTDALLEQKKAEQTSLLDELEALNTQLVAIHQLIAEHARQLQPLEAEEANLLGKAANVKRGKREIAAAEAAAAAAETAAADANRQLRTIHEESNENNNASSSSSRNNSNSSSVRSNNNNNNNNNNNRNLSKRLPGVPSLQQIRANIRGQSGELPYVKPLTSKEQKNANKKQRRQTKNLRTEFLKRQQALGLGSKNTKPDPYNDIANTQLERNSAAVLAKLNPYRGNKGTAKTNTTSTSPMTKRWRCTKPGTDLPCRTTGGTRRLRHRRRSTQKHKYNRKLNARTKRTKRQRR